MRGGWIVFCIVLLSSLSLALAQEDQPDPAPAAQVAAAQPDVELPEIQPAEIPEREVLEEMLQKDPISAETWSLWKPRLLSWIHDTSSRVDVAFEAASKLMLQQANNEGELSPPLSDDFFAQYLLGRNYLYTDLKSTNRTTHWTWAEKAYEKSIDLNPKFARAYRNMALAILLKEPDPTAQNLRVQKAEMALKKGAQLDPSLGWEEIPAQSVLIRGDYLTAERMYRKLWRENPANVEYAYVVAQCVIKNPALLEPYAERLKPIVEAVPQDGFLRTIYALAFFTDEQPRKGAEQLKLARELGFDPAQVIKPEIVAEMDRATQPSWFEKIGYGSLAFFAFYLLIMGTMAGTGLVLAGWTRGKSALHLLQDRPLQVVPKGQVVRAEGEPMLARLYAVALMGGLFFFYLSLPFVVLGVLGVTGGLLWLIFQANRIPIKLVVIIVVVGGAMAWAVIKSMFPRIGSGSFGIPKTKEECPKLFAALEEVATRVDTLPITEVYVSPGWDFGVHEEMRGPFGILGTKGRVLTIGLAAMKYLTVDEMKSILAHEYAHFSHRDTFFSRFIHRVDISIGTALGGMGEAGGYYNYVNPFFWFLWLYYKAYSLLSAGYSRSREFLADRMACSLYGANVFHDALRKVCTEGSLFEKTMYPTVSHLLTEGKSFSNMYKFYGEFRSNEETHKQREEAAQELDQERGSLFASHPTFRERVDATIAWPKNSHADDAVAMSLLEDGEAMEVELTEFLTAVLHLSQQQAATAAMENG